MSDLHASMLVMDVDLASFERAAAAMQPWPTAWTLPPFPLLECAELRELHHLRGVHEGHVRVSGTAPGGLVWELGGKVWMGPERWARPVWQG